MLVFIPAIGEFVIPTLLGGPNNLMIGRVLWDEFFGNRDWPVASAVAIVFLVLLVGPIACTSTTTPSSSRPRCRTASRPSFISALCIGIAVLYIPILVLIGYSFNTSALVSVWGGFSTRWYTELVHNDQILDGRAAVAENRRGGATGSVILGTLAAISLVRFKTFRGRLLLTGMVNAPLVMPEIITGITQLLLFVSMLHLLGWPHAALRPW